MRNEIRAMREEMQTFLRDTMREFTETLDARDQLRDRGNRRGRERDRDRDRVFNESESGATDEESNPFTDEERRPRYRDVLNHDRADRSWERGFKLDIPEFHGGVRGEELLDWLVAVKEVLEFKRVPDDRRVALVATKF